MHYLHAAISESMRLYPPVAVNTRRCGRDEFLPDGTFAGRGWQVSYSAYAMARVADVWGGDCEEFRPERWLDGGGAFRPMKSIVACVFERFTLRFAGGEGQPGLVLSLTLRMKGGLPMQVNERTA
ncbi:putative cytochrome P450-dependent fatty acid hydroxylase [Panicum miliaceum]|uniref:Cytochrome P450-dependent fatty acid hydroxylase n=1 Tax=Panicum miliaceum TaxID=4540 RepID=A0A3L6QSP4_PANMI|nr:putative cytochrome P450-dependent fatty acid hydroxylase [Panicum miliaceum]